jgi:lysozyme
MNVSENGIKLLSELEGRRPHAYLDSGGAPTIGVGHLLTKAERSSGKILIGGILVRYVNGLSEDQIDQLLRRDLDLTERIVRANIRVPLTQNQYDALVSFTFNTGTTGTTLTRLLNEGNYAAVPVQMRRWVHDNGKVVQGLVNRREKEIALWER